MESTQRKFVVYVEGTLYPWISLLEIGRDIMPTPQGQEGNDVYL
jgi:hypothetical protein